MWEAVSGVSTRQARVEAAILEACAEILQAMKDPRLGFASVVRVQCTPDMKLARIFVSVLGEEGAPEATLKVLEGARGHVRTELAHRLSLRQMPAIEFKIDRSMAHGDRIARLLRQVHPEPPA